MWIKFYFYGREWCQMLFDDGFNYLINNIEKNYVGKYMKCRRKVRILQFIFLEILRLLDLCKIYNLDNIW